jgi:ubiquinone/menaquinone biosynthesis C-methylase UbiE
VELETMKTRLLLARLLLIAALLLALCAHPMSVASAEQSSPRYEHRTSGDRNGIDKFYMGREIAHYMTHHGAPWLDRPERTREERTDLLLELLEVSPGDAVADIGAGSGFFTFPLAERVGPEGRVFAVDIQQEMLDIIVRRSAKRDIENVRTVLGTVDDPRLPEGEIDLALLVDVYHEMSHPWEMIDRIVASLAPGGTLVLVEYRGEDRWVPIKALHKMTAEQVRREMAVHDLKYVDNLDDLPRQHVLLFRKPSR